MLSSSFLSFGFYADLGHIQINWVASFGIETGRPGGYVLDIDFAYYRFQADGNTTLWEQIDVLLGSVQCECWDSIYLTRQGLLWPHFAQVKDSLLLKARLEERRSTYYYTSQKQAHPGQREQAIWKDGTNSKSSSIEKRVWNQVAFVQCRKLEREKSFIHACCSRTHLIDVWGGYPFRQIVFSPLFLTIPFAITSSDRWDGTFLALFGLSIKPSASWNSRPIPSCAQMWPSCVLSSGLFLDYLARSLPQPPHLHREERCPLISAWRSLWSGE